MRPSHFLAMIGMIVFLVACGEDHHLTSMSVSPSSASAASSSHGQAAFAATGTLNNGSSRALDASDGLIWSTSDSTIATIDSNGAATCMAPGTVTITGTAPRNLAKGSTSNAVSGTATLTCS